MQEVFQLQHVATFENGLALMIDDGLAVGLVLGAMKDQIDTKLLLHQLAKLFFVGSHIAVLQKDGAELFPSALIGFKSLQVLLNGGQRQGVDDVTIALDAEIAVFLVAFVAAGFEDGTELIEGRKLVVEGILNGLGCPLLLILAHDAVDDFLRTDALLVVVYLGAIRGYATGNDVQVMIVRVVVGIYKNRLSVLAIAQLTKVLVGNVQKLLIGVFVASAGDGEVELGLLDAVVILIGVIEEELFEFIGGVRLVNQVEAFHFKEFGNSLRDFTLVVINGMEGGARRQDGGYHLQNY